MGVVAGESWVASAQDGTLGRPLAALPYCVFRGGAGEPARVGVGIGDKVLDLARSAELSLLDSLSPELRVACSASVLNPLIACGRDRVAGLRARLAELLGSVAHRAVCGQALVGVADVELMRPVDVLNFTDFYASREHAENVGRLFRPERPLLPNYDWVPIGYHGRASSLVGSGVGVRRPWGQVKRAERDMPVFQPTGQLDYEAEVGAYVFGGNVLGQAVSVGAAGEQIFGLTLVNDWSARDVQAWEYQPLGPFLGKSFATSVGGWVVPWEALAPYRVAAGARLPDGRGVLAYLQEDAAARSALLLTIEASLETAETRKRGLPATVLGRSNMAGLRWTLPQMIAHHTSNGCNLQAGDLLATGTISGAGEDERGCLLEITRRGESPLTLASGEKRVFLEDGDTVVLRGWCEREDLPSISLGECRGTVLPAYSG